MIAEHEPLRWFVPQTNCYSNGTTWTADVADPTGSAGAWQWEIAVNDPEWLVMYYPGRISLGGLVRQGKTLNPLGYSVSRWFSPTLEINSGTADLFIHWVTSTRQIPAPLFTPGGAAEYGIAGGETYNDLVGYQTQTWTSDSTISSLLMRPIDTQTFGTLQPTVNDDLYTLCQVSIQLSAVADNDVILIPPSVVTIPQEIMKEDELEYIYRLKRFNDLSQVEN